VSTSAAGGGFPRREAGAANRPARRSRSPRKCSSCARARLRFGVMAVASCNVPQSLPKSAATRRWCRPADVVGASRLAAKPERARSDSSRRVRFGVIRQAGVARGGPVRLMDVHHVGRYSPRQRAKREYERSARSRRAESTSAGQCRRCVCGRPMHREPRSEARAEPQPCRRRVCRGLRREAGHAGGAKRPACRGVRRALNGGSRHHMPRAVTTRSE
jgi:hypothetical protein